MGITQDRAGARIVLGIVPPSLGGSGGGGGGGGVILPSYPTGGSGSGLGPCPPLHVPGPNDPTMFFCGNILYIFNINFGWLGFCPCVELETAGSGSVTPPPVGVTTLCCPNVVPYNLVAILNGGCFRNTALNLNYNAGVWSTTNFTLCGMTGSNALQLTCSPGPPPVWNLAWATTGAGACTDAQINPAAPAQVNCDPFFLEWPTGASVNASCGGPANLNIQIFQAP